MEKIKKFFDRALMPLTISSFFVLISYSMFFSDVSSLQEIRTDKVLMTMLILTVALFCGVFISIAMGKKK